MSYYKLSYKQFTAICNFIKGIRKFNVEPSNYIDLSNFDEYSYDRTNISSYEASNLFNRLQSFMNDIHKTRCGY